MMSSNGDHLAAAQWCSDSMCTMLHSTHVVDVLLVCSANLMAAREQQSDSRAFPGMENTTQFGVSGPRKDTTAAKDETAKHTDQPMFSCGSLAPKLRAGGCMDHGFSRSKEPWEASDGAVYLLRELSDSAADTVKPRLEALCDLATMRHFEHAPKLRETVWACVPVIARRLGKQAMKPHLEALLDPLFRDLNCGAQLCECAAGACVAALRDWLGVNVLAARLDDWQKMQLMRNKNIPEKVAWQGIGDDTSGGAPGPKKVRGLGANKDGIAARMRELPPGSPIPNLLGK
jgi:hypothetical protein